jgi:hypothetical protein
MSAWDHFLDVYFRRPTRDGPDGGVIERLNPFEREQAFQMLLAAAQQPGAILAVAGLGYLRDPRAVGVLYEIMLTRRDETRLYAAFALWLINEDPVALETLCTAVVQRQRVGGAHERMSAAVFLRQIDRHEARRALAVAIHDPDSLVRYHAYEGLLPVLGRSREIWNYVCKPDIHHHVRARVDAALRRAGIL